MDLRQLEMFRAVAENNSFTKASQELRVAQSAISRKIGMLEEELGTLLFKRVNRRIYLTPSGETLLRYTRRIFRDLENAAMEVSEMGRLQRGRLKVGAGMIACIYILPAILERFKEEYPDVEIEVITGPTTQLIDRLRENEIDLGLFTLPVDFPDLKVIPLFTEEMVVVSSPKHPTLAKRKRLRARELADYPLILFQEGTYTRKLLDDFFSDVGIVPKISMAAENVATMKPLVKIDLGISILPARSVQEEIERKELHLLRISDFKLKRAQGLVFQKSAAQPKILSELIRFFDVLEETKTETPSKSDSTNGNPPGARNRPLKRARKAAL